MAELINLVGKDKGEKNILQGLSTYFGDQKLIFHTRDLGKMGDEGNKTLFSSPSHHHCLKITQLLQIHSFYYLVSTPPFSFVCFIFSFFFRITCKNN